MGHCATVVVRAASEQHCLRRAHTYGPYMAYGVWPHQMDCARLSARSCAGRALERGASPSASASQVGGAGGSERPKNGGGVQDMLAQAAVGIAAIPIEVEFEPACDLSGRRRSRAR